jgi:ribosome-binding protein aMBF1 (putative translation factor)
MEKCSHCKRSEEEVRLFDGLLVNNTVKICERCSLIEGIPIIKRPSTNQLRDSEKPYAVRQRLARMAHLPQEQKKIVSAYDELKKLEEKPELERPEDLVFNLVDNFHWIIQTERRRRGFSQKQLASELHEGESAIAMLEKGIIPSKSLDLIRTLEQFLKVNLVKRDFMDKLEEEKRKNIMGLEQRSPVIAEAKTIPVKTNPSAKDTSEFKIRDLQRSNERIEHDFSYPRKSREQVGNEQMEDVGKEDTAYLKKNIMKDALKTRGDVPTIYDLMKKKQEKEHTSVTGKDIELE